jgi:hypothetical protein
MYPVVRFIAFIIGGAALGVAFALFVVTVCIATANISNRQQYTAILYGLVCLVGGAILGCVAGVVVAVRDYRRKR